MAQAGVGVHAICQMWGWPQGDMEFASALRICAVLNSGLFFGIGGVRDGILKIETWSMAGV